MADRRLITPEEVAKHNTDKDCWVIIDNKVYDVTAFLKEHPGGKGAIFKHAGGSAHERFFKKHNAETLAKNGPKMYVGDLAPSATTTTTTAAAKTTPPLLTLEEVSKHNTEHDCWIVIDNKVYNVTAFLNEHPGGKSILLKVAGKDATQQFVKFHEVKATLAKYGPKLLVGDLHVPGAAPQQGGSGGGSEEEEQLIPYGEPNYTMGWNNPGFYNESHFRFQKAVRHFVETEITPNCHDWDEQYMIPKELFKKAYRAGVLPASVGYPWPTKYAGANIAGGLKPEEYDAFHFLIFLDELARCGSGGVCWGLYVGLAIGLPPVLHFGSEELKQKVCPPCLKGDAICCLAITEPQAGSDVANLTCEAKKSPCGTHYTVNGEKKWITNGIWADFFTVAVRTGGPGMGGISLLVIEKNMPGVTTRHMKCMGVWASGTTYINFENVKVPIANRIGEENQGFKYIMYNFNNERLGFCAQANRFSRVCYSESFKYALKRKTFGKRLIDHPVIRMKLAEMARQVEANWAWLEQLVYQLKTMTWSEGTTKLGGQVALMKVHNSKTFEFCAREAAQIFGGLSYSRGGQGEKVERLYREVRAWAIPGGSEEIMLDLGVKQVLKQVDREREKEKRKVQAKH
eukprot:GDKI01018432.1.p1 GENE.GDKI01018432.1~~GDKI01018432.1.p1  ORF type:complete len:665 (+),score=221.15 GDKI01018432.1:116-1996(+)